MKPQSTAMLKSAATAVQSWVNGSSVAAARLMLPALMTATTLLDPAVPTSASSESAAIDCPPCERRPQGNSETAEDREGGAAATEVAGAVAGEAAATI